MSIYTKLPKWEFNSYFLSVFVLFIYFSYKVYDSTLNLHLDKPALIELTMLKENFLGFEETANSHWNAAIDSTMFLKYQLMFLILSYALHSTSLFKSVGCKKEILMVLAIITNSLFFTILVPIICILMCFLFTILTFLPKKSKYYVILFGFLYYYLFDRYVASSFLDTQRKFLAHHDSIYVEKIIMLSYPLIFLTIIRCIMMAMERLSEKSLTPISLREYIVDNILYLMWPYNVFCGPLIMYSDWCARNRNITPKGCITKRFLSLPSLTFRFARLVVWFYFWRITMTYLYPNLNIVYSNLNQPPDVFSKVNETFSAIKFEDHFKDKSVIALSFSLYLIGMTFYFAYLVIYGMARWLNDTHDFITRYNMIPGEYDQLIPDGPRCISHVFLYSEMWQKFDVGLYNFVKLHIYLPFIYGDGQVRKRFYAIDTADKETLSNRYLRLRKAIAALLTFSSILIYHSISWKTMIWLVVNMVQIILEKLIIHLYMNTSVGEKARYHLSPRNIRRLSAVLMTLSGIISHLSAMFFIIGFTHGKWVTVIALHNPEIIIPVLMVMYMVVQISIDSRKYSGIEYSALVNSNIKQKT